MQYIYINAGILDSAYMYAAQLIHSSDPNHKETGYFVILKPELRSFIPSDSVEMYFSNYGSILKTSYNSNNSKLAINQAALYNYQLQERERVKAEKREKSIKNWLLLTIGFVLMAISYILYLKYRNKDRIIELQKTLNDVKKLCQQLTDEKIPAKSESSQQPTEDNLRDEIRSQLLAAATEKQNCKLPINSSIVNSESYNRLIQHIQQEEILKEKDPLWHDLEKVVLKYYPDFKKKLILLSSGKLSVSDLQLALLIKCGISPSQIMVILGKSNGAIISRRDTLAKKLFGSKLPANVINNAISLL